MRFLCISCDTQMKLINTESATTPDARGSLSVKYECPECLMSIGMLTNPFETQLVSSLGVEIGGSTVDGEKSAAPSSESKCPFSHQARDAMIKGDSSLLDQEMLKAKENKTTSDNVDSKEVKWTAQAMVRLERIPEFIRAVAKKGIEKYAVEQGYAQVDEKCLDYAKDHFNM